MTTPSDLGGVEQAPAAGDVPRRLHPLSPVFSSIGLWRVFIPQAVVAVGVGGVRLLAVLVAVQLVGNVVAWTRRSYAFDGDVLVVRSGVFTRSEQLVPARRVQQVNVVQKLLHRGVGVAELRVETAGGGSATTTLDVLAADDAHRLRDALLAAKAGAVRPVPEASTPVAGAEARPGAPEVPGAPAAPAWVPAPWPVLAIRYGRLAVAGLTGAELLVIFAAVGSVAGFALELDIDLAEEAGGLDVRLGWLAVAGLVLVAVAVWLASAAATSIVRNGGFELTLLGDELHLRRGLLERKEVALPLRRIQAARIDATPPRRLLGLVAIRLQSAGRGAASDDTRLDVPIADPAELARVLELSLPGAAPVPPLRRPPLVALRRDLTRRLVPTALVAVPVGAVVRPVGTLAALVALAAAAAWGVAAHRARGHALDTRYLYARSGAFVRRTIVTPVARAQSARITRSPLQRRLGLATLVVDLAGPGANPRVVDETDDVVEALLRGVVDTVGRPSAGHPPTGARADAAGGRH